MYSFWLYWEDERIQLFTKWLSIHSFQFIFTKSTLLYYLFFCLCTINFLGFFHYRSIREIWTVFQVKFTKNSLRALSSTNASISFFLLLLVLPEKREENSLFRAGSEFEKNYTFRFVFVQLLVLIYNAKFLSRQWIMRCFARNFPPLWIQHFYPFTWK